MNRPGLVGLQFLRFAEAESLWFDPGRHYMLMERVGAPQLTGPGTRYVVVHAQQTLSGRWYPAVADTDGRELRVLVDDDPVFDESVFDAASLR